MLNAQQIEQIKMRIEQQVHPQKIVLFGSYATGQAKEDSDVDLLVVADTTLPVVKRYGWIRRMLDDLPASFDIIVKTPAEYDADRTVMNHIVYFADQYGKVIYER